jgi:hypothetical protein
VLGNYSKFVAGVTEVASVERDLQARALHQMCHPLRHSQMHAHVLLR